MSELDSRIADALFVGPGQNRVLDPVRNEFLKALKLPDDLRQLLSLMPEGQLVRTLEAMHIGISHEADHLSISDIAYRVPREIEFTLTLHQLNVKLRPDGGLKDNPT